MAQRMYQQFLTAAAISALGDGLLVTALPLLASAATNNKILISAVFSAGRVPWVFAVLFGAGTDRLDAKRVMILADVFRAALLVLLAIWLVGGSGIVPIWVLIGIAVPLSIGEIVFWSASQRAIPILVKDEQLAGANSSLNTLTIAGNQFIGPQLGALFGSGSIPVVGDAISFAGSAALLRDLPPMVPIGERENVRDGARSGMAWFAKDPVVRAITLVMTAVAFVTGAPLATEVILVKSTLGHKQGWWFGVLTVVMGLGSMIGSWLAPRIIKRLGATTTPMAIAVSGLAFVALVGSRNTSVAFGAMFLQQAATLVALVDTVSIRQRAIPDRLRGRVMVFSRSIAFGSQTLSGLAGGWLVERHGTDPMFLAAGVCMVAISMIAARPLKRLLVASKIYQPGYKSVEHRAV